MSSNKFLNDLKVFLQIGKMLRDGLGGRGGRAHFLKIVATKYLTANIIISIIDNVFSVA